MAVMTACPERHVLEQFLLGQLSLHDTEQLAKHLESCSACTGLMLALRANDPLLDSLRGLAAGGDQAEPVVVERLITQLKALPSPSAETLSIASPGDTGPPTPAAGLVTPRLPPAEEQLGPYRILQILGGGGMGIVYLAEDSRLDRRVALKVMRPELASSSHGRERFLREAKTAAAVEHDHIVTVFEVNETSAGDLYLAMPYLQGESLEERLRHGAPLALSEVCRLGAEIASGLAAAHARGLIHRDIKPSNIWLEDKGQGSEARGQGAVSSGQATSSLTRDPWPLTPVRVKILDFGLARPVEGSDLSLPGSMLGTPAYMAPEQARGENVDARSDLFSLGCVLYRMATGQAAFRGDNALALVHAIQHHEPTPPRTLRPDIPPVLEQLIVRLLRKDRAARPATATEVAQALRTLAGTPASTATGSPLPDDAPALPSPSHAVEAPAPPAHAGRELRLSLALTGLAKQRRGCVVTVTVALVVLAMPSAYILMLPHRDLPSHSDHSQIAVIEGKKKAIPDSSGPKVAMKITTPAQKNVGQHPVPAAQPPLKGFIDALVLRREAGQKRSLSLSDPAALPLRLGAEDYVRIEAKLNRPAYMYLVWVDTAGQVDLVYPWDEAKKCRLPNEKPEQHVYWPSEEEGGFLQGGPKGTATLLLLARDEKLPEDQDIPALFGKLGPQPSQERREAAWFEDGRPLTHGEEVQGQQKFAPINFPADRGVTATKTARVDAVMHVQTLLRTTLKERFPYSRAVCFSCEPGR
jgi:serine/threonine protein kinase